MADNVGIGGEFGAMVQVHRGAALRNEDAVAREKPQPVPPQPGRVEAVRRGAERGVHVIAADILHAHEQGAVRRKRIGVLRRRIPRRHVGDVAKPKNRVGSHSGAG